MLDNEYVYKRIKRAIKKYPKSVEVLAGIPEDVERVLKKYLDRGDIKAVKTLMKAFQKGDFFDVLDTFLDDFRPIEVSIAIYLDSDELLDVAVDLLTCDWLNVDIDSIDYHEGPSGAELYLQEFFSKLEKNND
jgi:hypothetical protein